MSKVSKQRTTPGQKQTYNSPTFAYLAVYSKEPEEFLSGRSEHPQRTWNGISVDEPLKNSWLEALNSIEGTEVRASCCGHSEDRVAYVVIRLTSGNDEQAKEVSEKLNHLPGCYSLADIGDGGKMRIVIAGKVWEGSDGWSEWWTKLAGRIEGVVKEVLDAKEKKAEKGVDDEKTLEPEEVAEGIEKNVEKKVEASKQLREAFADLAHQQWSGWMRYLFQKGAFGSNGTWTMLKEFVERWQRQMNTPFEELSLKEKNSDRKEADKFLAVIEGKKVEDGISKNFSINQLSLSDQIKNNLQEGQFSETFIEKANFFSELCKMECQLPDASREMEESSNSNEIEMHRRFRLQKMNMNTFDDSLHETFSNQATLSYLLDLYAVTGSSIDANQTVKKQLFEKDEEIILKSGAISPVFISKKFEGVPIALFVSSDRISIFSEEGQWVEDGLPDLVAEVKKTKQPSENYCLVGKLEWRKNGDLQSKEMILEKFRKNEIISGTKITFNVEDVLYADEDVHSITKSERRTLLETFNFEQCTMDIPDENIILNLVPELLCETLNEANEALTKCSKAIDSDGSVIALADALSSAYSLSGTTQAVFKQRQHASISALVGKVDENEGMFRYELFLRFRSSDNVNPRMIEKIGDQEYIHIGRSYRSEIRAKVGDILLISFHSMNSYEIKLDGKKVYRLYLYEPVVKKFLVNETDPDFFSTAIKVGENSGLLIEKEFTKAMDLIWRVPEKDMKNFVPDYRRSDSHDQGVLKMDSVPKELRKGRFVWFVTDDPGEDFDKIDRELEVENIEKSKKDPKIGQMTLTNKRVTDLEEGEGTYPRTSGRYRGVSIGKDSHGFFVFTHRIRSKSYPSLDKIPEKVIKWIASTG